VLLLILIAGVSLAGYALTPVKGEPSTSVIVATTSSTSINATKLIISLQLSNGTMYTSGSLFAGQYQSSYLNGSYVFQDIPPASYSLNFTGPNNIFFPPLKIVVQRGVNLVKAAIFPLESLKLVETSGFAYNGTLPGPTIDVRNGTAMRIELFNNTTQITDLAIVNSLSNFNQSSVEFNSVSNTLSPGGSTNDTFIVSSLGTFYYTSLIGSQARNGQYGHFIVSS
jgi:FtsP/CotA-like multicopper oxidase with cupredoxin domain